MSQIHDMPKDGRAVHFCPGCCAAYPTKAEALQCAAVNTDKPFAQPGQIIVWDSGYTWFDGKPDWVARKVKNGSLHGDMDSYDLFMVVTAVTPYYEVNHCQPFRHVRPNDAHRAVLHVKTLAIGIKDGLSAWTPARGHRSLKHIALAKVPVTVLAAGAKLVGQKFDRLL